MIKSHSTMTEAPEPIVFQWLDAPDQDEVCISDSSFHVAPAANALNENRGFVERTSAGVIFYTNGSDVQLNGCSVEQAWLKVGDVLTLGGQALKLVSLGHVTPQSSPRRPSMLATTSLRFQLTNALQARSTARKRLKEAISTIRAQKMSQSKLEKQLATIQNHECSIERLDQLVDELQNRVESLAKELASRPVVVTPLVEKPDTTHCIEFEHGDSEMNDVSEVESISQPVEVPVVTQETIVTEAEATEDVNSVIESNTIEQSSDFDEPSSIEDSCRIQASDEPLFSQAETVDDPGTNVDPIESLFFQSETVFDSECCQGADERSNESTCADNSPIVVSDTRNSSQVDEHSNMVDKTPEPFEKPMVAFSPLNAIEEMEQTAEEMEQTASECCSSNEMVSTSSEPVCETPGIESQLDLPVTTSEPDSCKSASTTEFDSDNGIVCSKNMVTVEYPIKNQIEDYGIEGDGTELNHDFAPNELGELDPQDLEENSSCHSGENTLVDQFQANGCQTEDRDIVVQQPESENDSEFELAERLALNFDLSDEPGESQFAQESKAEIEPETVQGLEEFPATESQETRDTSNESTNNFENAVEENNNPEFAVDSQADFSIESQLEEQPKATELQNWDEPSLEIEQPAVDQKSDFEQQLSSLQEELVSTLLDEQAQIEKAKSEELSEIDSSLTSAANNPPADAHRPACERRQMTDPDNPIAIAHEWAQQFSNHTNDQPSTSNSIGNSVNELNSDQTTEIDQPAEPVAKTAAEPESVADILARMRAAGELESSFDMDQETQNEDQHSDHAAAQSNMVSQEPENALKSSAEPSVQEYMNQLLNRLNTGPTMVSAPPTVATKVKKTEIATEEPESLEPVNPMRADEFVPKQAAPEKKGMLEHLRQVANQSTRSAVNTSIKRKNKDLAKVYLAGAGIGLALSAVGFSMSARFLDSMMLLSMCFILASVFCCFKYLSSRGVTIKLPGFSNEDIESQQPEKSSEQVSHEVVPHTSPAQHMEQQMKQGTLQHQPTHADPQQPSHPKVSQMPNNNLMSSNETPNAMPSPMPMPMPNELQNAPSNTMPTAEQIVQAALRREQAQSTMPATSIANQIVPPTADFPISHDDNSGY